MGNWKLARTYFMDCTQNSLSHWFSNRLCNDTAQIAANAKRPASEILSVAIKSSGVEIWTVFLVPTLSADSSPICNSGTLVVLVHSLRLECSSTSSRLVLTGRNQSVAKQNKNN